MGANESHKYQKVSINNDIPATTVVNNTLIAAPFTQTQCSTDVYELQLKKWCNEVTNEIKRWFTDQKSTPLSLPLLPPITQYDGKHLPSGNYSIILSNVLVAWYDLIRAIMDKRETERTKNQNMKRRGEILMKRYDKSVPETERISKYEQSFNDATRDLARLIRDCKSSPQLIKIAWLKFIGEVESHVTITKQWNLRACRAYVTLAMRTLVTLDVLLELQEIMGEFIDHHLHFIHNKNYVWKDLY